MKKPTFRNWPVGKASYKVYRLIDNNAQRILTGRMLAIDPASGGSSMPGWAVFDNGELVASGELSINSKSSVQFRLAEIQALLCGWDFDILAIEQLRGARVHCSLYWSVGAIIAAVAPSLLIEVPTNFWKVLAPRTYEKTDEQDAIYIGETVVELAKGHHT